MVQDNIRLIMAMMEYEKGCPQRIQHFLKVLAFTELIGELEGVDKEIGIAARVAAIVHDIGIRPSLAKYGSAAGHYQESEGPPVARSMLEALGYEADLISRVCYLVGHHHTYLNIDGLDHQILVEADFLVNIFEGKMELSRAKQIRQSIFRTKGGKEIFDLLYC